MNNNEGIYIDLTKGQVFGLAFYYTVGVFATSYMVYKVTSWGMTKVCYKVINMNNNRKIKKYLKREA